MALHDNFRKALKATRKEQGLSQAAVAKRSGYCANYVAKIERGTKPNPSLKFIEDIAITLGVDPLDMLKEE